MKRELPKPNGEGLNRTGRRAFPVFDEAMNLIEDARYLLHPIYVPSAFAEYVSSACVIYCIFPVTMQVLFIQEALDGFQADENEKEIRVQR